MMQQLKTACKNHYQQQSLSTEQLARLMALQKRNEQPETVDERDSSNPFTATKMRRLLALAASLCIIIFSGWIYKGYNVDMREQIAKEIAYNHSKQMALEITSGDLNTVAAYLSELDFALVDSSRVRQMALQLLGGRYCSIQGKLAAQLKIEGKNSKTTHTYYQAIIPDNLNLNGATYSTWIKGTYIELWVEGDLLLGLASDQPVMPETTG